MGYFKDTDSLMAYLDEEMKKREIHCPYCSKEYDRESQLENLVTYWGEDGEVEVECGHCDKSYMVEEVVTRTYDVRKKEEKNDEEDDEVSGE
jgi:uncharacterized Zn-finger protein